MYKLIFFILFIMFFIMVLSISFVYFKNKMFDILCKDTIKQKKLYKENNTNNPLYLEARNLFNAGMKSRALKRNDIIALIELLEQSMGKQHSKVYKNFKFKNDCHRIYVYLKSKEISIVDMKRIIKFLERRLSN